MIILWCIRLLALAAMASLIIGYRVGKFAFYETILMMALLGAAIAFGEWWVYQVRKNIDK